MPHLKLNIKYVQNTPSDIDNNQVRWIRLFKDLALMLTPSVYGCTDQSLND